MKNLIKILSGVVLLLFVSQVFAIQVSVRTSYKDVAAIGFSANGTNYGGRGSSYSRSDLPVGVYSFGMRIGSVFGTDVTCPTNKGQHVKLNKNTSAVIIYDGKRCVTKLYSR